MATKNIVFLIVCSIILQAVVGSPSKRQINTDETKKRDERICGQSTPCGWAVYSKITRTLDYFMKNKCACTTDAQCVRDQDDISINAFVYRCKATKS